MFRNKVSCSYIEPVVLSNEALIVQSAVVDQTVTQEFNLNAFGHPRSTISALAHCQTVEQYKAIVESLQKVDPKFNMKPSKDGRIGSYSPRELADAYALVKPRWCQMPNELDAFASQLAQYDSNKITSDYEKMVDEKAAAAAQSAAPAPATADN